MNRKIIILAYFLFGCFIFVNAQNKEEEYNKKKVLKEVRANIKSQKYSQAEDLVRKSIEKYEEARTDAEMLHYEMNLQHNLAADENKKIFLNNKPDTTKYFNCIYNVYHYALICDSLDKLPDRKGRVKPRYSSNISDRLNTYRNNIKSAGKFFYKHQKYADAYKFINLYLSTRNNPYILAKLSPTQIADSMDVYRLALYTTYNNTDYKTAVEFLPKVMTDTLGFSYHCQLGSKSLMEIGDTVSAIKYLYDGWHYDPAREYFYVNLVDYHIGQKQYDMAYEVVTKQLEIDPLNRRLWYIKGKCEQCLDSLDQALLSYHKVIYLAPEDAQAHSSMGDIYLQKARDAYKTNEFKVGTRAYTRAKRLQTDIYKQSREAYELARKYAPDNKNLWLAGLREVYYKLNMGKELKELEKL